VVNAWLVDSEKAGRSSAWPAGCAAAGATEPTSSRQIMTVTLPGQRSDLVVVAGFSRPGRHGDLVVVAGFSLVVVAGFSRPV
jgi:hypothetical protein